MQHGAVSLVNKHEAKGQALLTLRPKGRLPLRISRF
jgi:hypothetical protein